MNPFFQSIDLPPPQAQVAVEGGHFSARPRFSTARIISDPGIHYLDVPQETPQLPYEFRREADDNDSSCSWVVLDVPAGATVALPPNVHEFRTASFAAPSIAEFESFRVAAGFAEMLQQEQDISRVALHLLVGDLYVPPPLRRPIDWAVPAAYRALLGRLEEVPRIILSESACRNTGYERVVRRARRMKKEALERLYRDSGFTLVSDGPVGEGIQYLASDALASPTNRESPVVALTKYGTRPACATTLAGKLFDLGRRGFTHLIACYDASIDPDIRRKNIDGVIVAAAFFPRLDMDVQIITLDGDLPPKYDRLNTAALRKPGRQESFELLRQATHGRVRRYGLELIGAQSPAECCPYPRGPYG